MKLMILFFTTIFTHLLLNPMDVVSIPGQKAFSLRPIPVRFICSYDPFVQIWRKLFAEEIPCETSIQAKEAYQKILNKNKDILCMGPISPDRDHYVCYNFAIEMLAKNYEVGRRVKCYKNTKTINITLQNYCERVSEPQGGDIALYGIDEGVIEHFAYVVNENEFLSKFGTFPQIIKHLPSHVPIQYGNSYIVLRLLPKYQKNKELLSKNMLDEIKKNGNIV